jgi:periplasmic protein TonB
MQPVQPLPTAWSPPQRSRRVWALGVLGLHAAAVALGLSLGSQIDVSVLPATGPLLQVRLLPGPVQAPAAALNAAASPAKARAPVTVPTFVPTLVPTLVPMLVPPVPPLSVPVPPAMALTTTPSDVQPRAVAQAGVAPVRLSPPPASTPPVVAATPASAPLRLTRGPLALPGNPMPAYPQAAREDGLEGPVDLRVEVTAQGQVRQVDWARRSGILLLDLAARDAVRQWRFQPALQAGEPVAGSLHVVIRFRLDAPVTLVALSDAGSR